MRVRAFAAAAVAAGLITAGLTASGASGEAGPTGPRPGAATPSFVQAMRDPVAPRRLPPRLKMPTLPIAPATPLTPQRIGVEEAADVTLGSARERVHRFHFPGADYVKVHLSDLDLLPGDRVTVADPTGTEVHAYRSGRTLTDLLSGLPVSYDESGGFWSMSVTGDTAVVTLQPAGEALTRGPVAEALAGYGLTIDKVAHGLTGAGDEGEAPAGPGREESICGGDDSRDAVCYRSDHPTEYAHSRPVARLLINGTSLCTAWRIGPRNRMITNHHCFGNDYQARNTEVWFDYQCRACGDHRVGRVTKVWGADVLATERRLDYTLFTVDDFEAIRDFGHLELDNRRVARGEEVYLPQHPNGDPKRISVTSDADSRGACRVDDPTYDGYAPRSDVSYYCDTSSGSSGSPVLSRRTHKVIALHHFGGCPNSGVRADLLHDALAGKL